jgi:hypothetical protein
MDGKMCGVSAASRAHHNTGRVVCRSGGTQRENPSYGVIPEMKSENENCTFSFSLVYVFSVLK